MSCGVLFYKTPSKFWQSKWWDTQSAQAEWVGDKSTQLSFAAKMDQTKCSLKSLGNRIYEIGWKKPPLYGGDDSSNS